MADYRYWETEREQIMIRLKRKLDILFPHPDVCKFHAVCAYYVKENPTCSTESEACHHCGKYKLHEAAILQGEMKKMLSDTDFADFDV